MKVFALASLLPLVLASKLHTGSSFYSKFGVGACGKNTTANDKAVAVFTDMFKDGDACGKKIKVVGRLGTVTDVEVVDVCEPYNCNEKYDIMLTERVFEAAVGDYTVGRDDCQWKWVDE